MTGTTKIDLVSEIKKLCRYLLCKRSELDDIDLKDMVLAKAILDIHRKRTRKVVVSIPLFAIRQIHLLDRENAIQTTQNRVEVLRAYREVILREGRLTCRFLADYLPSVSWIKLVREGQNSYLAFEGNGRIAAMQTVFKPTDDLMVEAEEYVFRNPERIIRRLNRVRRLNGLL